MSYMPLDNSSNRIFTRAEGVLEEPVLDSDAAQGRSATAPVAANAIAAARGSASTKSSRVAEHHQPWRTRRARAR